MIDDFNKGIGSDDFNLNEEDNDEPKINLMDQIKPYVGPIIKIIIVIVIAFLVYYFVWGNKVNVTIYAYKDGKIYDTSVNILKGEKLILTTNVETPIKLVKGNEYTVKIDPPSNYFQPTTSETLIVEEDDLEHRIDLLPLWAAGIKTIDAEIPEVIYKGQLLEFDVTVDYTGTGASVNITGTNDFNDLSMPITLKNGKAKYTINFYIPRTIQSGKTTFSGKICIENSLKCTVKVIQAAIKDQPSITLQPKPSTNITVSAGSTFTLNILVNNKKNKITDIKDLNVSLESVLGLPTDMTAETFIDMINIMPPQNIPKDTDGTIVIRGSIPLNFAEKQISFFVRVKNSFLDLRTDQITLNISKPNLEITKSVDFEQTLAGETKTQMITITNNTDFELTNVNITFDNHSVTQNTPNDFRTWITTDETTSFSIPSKGTKQIKVIFTPSRKAVTDEFTLNAKINTDSGEFIIPIKGKIKGINVNMEITFPNENIQLSKNNQTGQITPYNGTIKITNKSDTKITLAKIEITDAQCINTFGIKLSPLISFEIDPSAYKEVALTVAPAGYNPAMLDKSCYFIVSYFDPTSEGSVQPETKQLEKLFWIKVPTQ